MSRYYKELKLTAKERQKVYKKAYKIHLYDISISKGIGLNGMCSDIEDALYQTYLFPNKEYYKIISTSERLLDLFPEFAKLKPKDKTISEFWWDNRADNNIRITKYQKLIK